MPTSAAASSSRDMPTSDGNSPGRGVMSPMIGVFSSIAVLPVALGPAIGPARYGNGAARAEPAAVSSL